MAYIIFYPLVGLLFLLAGAYVLALDPKSSLHRIFFGLSFLLCVSSILALTMQFEAIYSRPQLLDGNAKAGAINFMWIIYALLMFNVVLTRMIPMRWFIWLLGGLIPLYLSVRLVLLEQVATYTHINGKLQCLEYNAIFGSMNNYMSIYLVIMIVLLVLWHRRTSLKKVKKQARILMAAQVLTILGMMIDTYFLFYLSDVFKYKTPGATTFYFIIWYVGMAYALLKLRLIIRNRMEQRLKAMSEIEEGVLVLGPEYRILWYNEAFAQLLGLEDQAFNLGMADLIQDEAYFYQELARLDSSKKKSLSTRLDLAFRGMELLRVEAKVSVLDDEFGDSTGYLLIVKEAKTLHHLKQRYGITKRETEVIQLIVAGLSNQDIARSLQIAERTVKAHITSIFNKMVVDNRVQLIIQLRKYRILPEFQADVLSVSNN